MKKSLCIMALLLLVFSSLLYAQFGKNIVNWEDEEYKFYQSGHFDVWYEGFNLINPSELERFQKFVGNLEGAYEWLSSDKVFNHQIKKRIPVLVHRTHSGFEANFIGPFLPEGVGAFVDFKRNRLVTKDDLLPQLKRAVNVHELVHEFQLDIAGVRFASRLPDWFIEGGAEFIAGLYDPHTRDDIRRREQRIIASNPKSLPNWYGLNKGFYDSYSMGEMIYKFLESQFGEGVALQVQGLKHKGTLGDLVYDIAKGKLGNPDKDPRKFDEAFRRYWGNLFELQRISKASPTDETENFKGRSLRPYDHPYPMLSMAVSPDGKEIACFTIGKYGVTLVKFPIPQEEPYSEKNNENKSEKKQTKDDSGLKNLTPWFPPIPVEYYIVQGFETWPFNGSDLSWSKTGKIAFFGRKNQDHALFIISSVEPKKLFRSIELSLDQAFSPAWNFNGEKIYFSAAKNGARDIYAINLTNDNIENLTKDERFDTAPAVSPDGKKIAYVGQDGDFQHLFLLDLETGTKNQLTFGRFNDNSPSWSSDGATIVYASDEIDRVWNLYTINPQTMMVSQWTDFFGQVATPVFAPGDSCKVYCVVRRDDAEYKQYIYSNDEIFEVMLETPIRQYTVQKSDDEPNYFSFVAERNLFDFELDMSQITSPKKPQEKLHLIGGSANLGFNSWGLISSSYLEWSNMTKTKYRLFKFINYGKLLTVLDYVHVNQERRLGWGYDVSYFKMPYFLPYYDLAYGKPNQDTLNMTAIERIQVGAFGQYPLNKFSRWEFFVRASSLKFAFSGIDEEQLNSDPFYLFLQRSEGARMSFGAAYVRDTVFYSYQTQGPFNGKAFRAEAKVAPSLSDNLKSYMSASIDWRMYRHLGRRSVFATRFSSSWASDTNGDFVLLGGPDTLRGLPYGSLAGNQVVYGSVELRFPLIDVLIFPANVGIGPFRGLLFADAGMVRWSDRDSSWQKGTSYGGGIQFLPLHFIWTHQDGKWATTFYLAFNW